MDSSTLVVQCGKKYELPSEKIANGHNNEKWEWEEGGLHIEVWRFKKSIADEIDRADWVISHAGSGTMLDTLRLSKPLIVVPNSSLLDDHQADLASALSKQGYLVSSTAGSLAETIRSFDPSSLIPFPPRDETKFRDILDEEMGFL